MARGKKHPAHENHERWLVSYADFITLMFAFFVVMYASAQADKSKAAAISASVREAMDKGQISAVVEAVLGKAPAAPRKPDSPAPPPPQRPPLEETLAALDRDLKPEIEKGSMRVALTPRGLVISLREAAFFDSGEDAIRAAGYDSIAKVARTLLKTDNPVRLEGHTDSVPIHNSRFRSNWELSAARSIAMLELLAGRFAVPRPRMRVAAYADIAPSDTNETAEGRAHTRRVDIVVLSRDAIQGEPPAARQPR